jgi:alkyl hydroperoxide reductase subunit AhpC
VQTPRNKGGLGAMAFPLIADLNKEMSKAFEVLIDGEGDGDKGVALRGTFVIDANGVVRAALVNDLPVGRSVDEILRLVKAFQHTDVHGEVCPAGWKGKGDKTMIADPVKSHEYFKTLA